MARAIEIAAAGKRYVLGEDFARSRYLTLRESLVKRVRRRSSDAGSELWALRNVDLTIDQGEIVGVIGRNAAGKSTLLKLLARITEPTTGVVRTRGRVGALLEVGTGFHPELTGRENVYLNGSILGMPRRDIAEQFDEIVAFAGFEEFLDTPLKRFSTGMGLRLAFAVAAHVRPPIMVFDEILAVGDAEFRKKCQGAMSQFGDAGRTVVFVSHDLAAVGQVCTRTVWLEEGRVAMDGPTGAVISAYLDSRVSAQPKVDLEVDGGGPVRLLGAEVIGADGHLVEIATRSETLTIRVRFELRELMPQLDLALTLVDSRGVAVMDELFSDTGQGSVARYPGVYEVTLRVPPVLAAGEYMLGAWAGAGDDTYFLRDLFTFNLWPGPDDPSDWQERVRVVQPAVQWAVRSGQAPSLDPADQ